MVAGHVGRMPPDSFTWSRWRAFGLFARLGIACRQNHILLWRTILKEHLVGWAKSEDVLCRPKEGMFAVMFLEDGEFTWCHLSEQEFHAVAEDN